MYPGVCFSPEKHALFNDISKDNNNAGIETKRFRSSETNEYVIINDFSSVKKTELDFESKILREKKNRARFRKEDFKRKPFTGQQVINECAIYDIVDKSGLVYNLQQETTSQKEGAPLRIRKGIMKDQTGSIEIAMTTGSIEIANNNCYDLKKMRIQQFMNNRILKSTESTTVTENSNINIELTDDKLNASPFEKIVNAKIIKVDAKTLIQMYLCLTCNTQVTINNAVGWCDICENAES